jgi:hypothetical protein
MRCDAKQRRPGERGRTRWARLIQGAILIAGYDTAIKIFILI